MGTDDKKLMCAVHICHDIITGCFCKIRNGRITPNIIHIRPQEIAHNSFVPDQEQNNIGEWLMANLDDKVWFDRTFLRITNKESLHLNEKMHLDG